MSGFQCQECGRRFPTVRAASNGCPGCGGVDIDLDGDQPRFTILDTRPRPCLPTAADPDVRIAGA